MHQFPNLDVLSHELKAAKGTNGQSSYLQEVLQEPHSWWERLFQPEEITVAGGKVVNKGIVLTPTMALTLFLALATVVGTIYWRMSDRIDAKDQAYQEQRDLLIRMDQRLIDKERHDAENKEELEKRLQNIDAVQIALGRDIAKAGIKKGP